MKINSFLSFLLNTRALGWSGWLARLLLERESSFPLDNGMAGK